MKIDGSGIICTPNLLWVGKDFSFAFGTFDASGHVVDPQYDVLTRDDDRTAVCRGKNIVAGEHQHPGLYLCFHGKRDVDRHLIPVKIGVKCRTNEGVKLQGFAFNENRFKGLNSQTVKGRGTVQKNRVFLYHFIQCVPDFRCFSFNYLFGAFYRGHKSFLLESIVDERLEHLQGHFLWQATLVQPQIRPNSNYRATGIVDPFAEQVLAEAPLLSF